MLLTKLKFMYTVFKME